MRAVIKEPGHMARVIEIDNTLEAMQKAVGGHIQAMPFASDATFIVNEEGLLLHLPYNIPLLGQLIVGPVVCVRTKGDHFASMKPVTAMKFVKWLNLLEAQHRERMEAKEHEEHEAENR